MQLPESLKIYQSTAKENLARGCVKHIEFSGPTYQVQVQDKKVNQDVWAFLQLDVRGALKDCFCSCDESEDGSSCWHIAAAYLKIYDDRPFPLHIRFERSLWNKLCSLYAKRMGDNPELLKQSGKGNFTCKSVGGKVVITIKGKSAEAIAALKQILQHRKIETEETSLKFSNLPQEEILLWREGRPSPQLSYELSFWSDLAKWLLSLDEKGDPYTIDFEYGTKQIPNYLHIHFDDVDLGFYLSEANLPLIIPALATVPSPLKVHNAPEDTIQKITYDKKKGILEVEPKKMARREKQTAKNGIILGGWLYVPGDGFYVQDKHSLLTKTALQGKEIADALNEHFSVVASFLEGTKIYEDPIDVSYAIAFDTDWNLLINCYLFNPGDLALPYSRLFGDWVYIDEDGFYKIQGNKFDQIETIVPAEEVSEFIRQHRTWLNMQDGFQTHLASVEAHLTYKVSHLGSLTFARKVAIAEEGIKSKEFGPWIYISGQGFFSKVNTQVGLPVRSGIALHAEQIPLFIRMNQEELKLIPDFFSEKCPVVNSGLDIELNRDDQITVSPLFELAEEYKEKPIRFFEDYVYIEGEGFHEIPIEHRLPERFRHPVTIEKENLPLFLTYELVALRRYATKIDVRLTKPESVELAASNISLAEGQEGKYILKLKYQTERGSIPTTTLWQAIKKKKRFVFDEAGLFDMEDKRFNWLKLLSEKQIDRRSHTIEMTTLELMRLNAYEELNIIKHKNPDYEHSKNLLEELTLFKIEDEPDLTGLQSQLRPYQLLGIRWLWFLQQHHLSGLLCDDMGLGKTHQSMALIAAIINHYKNKGNSSPRHFLVVCPTSVIYHWQEKLHAFLPSLRVCTFHGSQRSLEDFHQQYDVLLTSYGIWRIENELLSQVKFELAIFDEIQVAKNHSSRIYAALSKTDAKMRLGLTGTPIENRLRELKTLFDLVLPTYMPGEEDFKEFFAKPIEKEGNPERRKMLSRLIRPFVLRRKKGDVLLDLPEKIEEVSHCELSSDQEKLYLNLLATSRQKILDELKDSHTPIPYLHIFALLSSLKQVCNHPAVYLKQPEKYKDFQSGKWDLFIELLNEARDSRQKVVVFSQYLYMLDIIEDYLRETGIGFAAIRGATINRAEQLHRFNHDPDCEVFVASLQAAGLGVDLTAGSVVIHYDRWWNAARENQATDRVHRIGQTRGVQVFKLVTLGTFEEKINALIEKKGKLMEEVVGIDDHEVVKQFTRDEIIELLQYTRPM